MPAAEISAEKLDDYTIVNLALRWHPDLKVFGLVTPSAFVAVENLLDERYSSVGYETWAGLNYYPAPAVNVRGGMTLSF